MQRKRGASEGGDTISTTDTTYLGTDSQSKAFGADDVRHGAGDHPLLLRRLGLPDPTGGVPVGSWWFDPSALARWTTRVREVVDAHRAAHPLEAGPTIAEVLHRLDLPDHLRPAEDGGTLPTGLAAPGADLVRHVAARAGLAGRVRSAVHDATGLDVAAVLVVPRHPTDIRHNSKVDRTRLAAWAEDALSGGRIRNP